MRERTLVIGVGNEFRGDDAVGLHVARRVREMCGMHVQVEECSGDGTSLMALWEGFSRVILVDASASGAPPGQVTQLDGEEVARSAGAFRDSTHAFGVAEALAMARTLKHCPRTVTLYGIEGQNYQYGTALSPEVARAADEVARLLTRSFATE